MRTVKRPRVRLAIALAATAAMILPMTTATAKPHVVAGVPETVCSIGGVAYSGPQATGLPGDPGFNPHHFEFEANMTCTGKKGDTYVFKAFGDTTDINHGDKQKMGETITQAGTVKELTANGLWNYHTGTILADGDLRNLFGRIHFTRQGTVVVADGPLYVDPLCISRPTEPCPTPKDAEDQWFTATLTLTGHPDARKLALFGTAFIYSNEPFVDTCVENKPSVHCMTP